MRTQSERARRAARGFAQLALVMTFGCGAGTTPTIANTTPAADPAPSLDTLLVGESDTPSLFLSAAEDAPAIGWTTPDLAILPGGPDENGRTPVRIDGPLRVKAYVPTALLGHKVQRRGRLRGSAVYVAPNDRVQVLGTAADGRLRLSARPILGGAELGPFEGTFPPQGIAAQPAPADAEPPRAGQWHEVPAGTALALHESAGGPVQLTLPAREQPTPLEVLGTSGGWSAIRVGEGPYLIGYTNAALRPLAAAPARTARRSGIPPVAEGELPIRLQQEQGAVKRVAAGAKIRFSGQIIAVFKQPGWARVLAEFPNDQVDVFCAADNGVAVRGLIERQYLTDAPAPAAAPAPQ